MKSYKSFLLVSAVLTSVLPSSLYAQSTTTADALADAIRHTHARPAHSIEAEQPAKSGWFTSFRQKAGNALRWTGEQLRTEGNKQTNAGKVKEWAKEKAAQFTSSKVGVKLESAIFNPIGNGLRKLGQWIKGGKETQTPTRVVLDTLALSPAAHEFEVERALKIAASAAYKADSAKSSTLYSKVVEGMIKRGHVVPQSADAIFVESVAGEVLSKDSKVNFETFRVAMLNAAMEKVEGLGSVKSSFDKPAAMDEVLRRIFETHTAKVQLNKMASPAA